MSARHGVVILGSGNVASALAPVLDSAGYPVRQVFSRTVGNAQALAAMLPQAVAVDTYDSIVRDAALYVVSLTDTSIPAVAEAMANTGGLWVHTSGGVPACMLSPASAEYGVLYPLQTFSKGRTVDFSEVPLFIEGNSPETFAKIKDIAERISNYVSEADSAKRLRLHAAAVFACNFVNYLWSNADSILTAGGESLEVLYPLIKETLAKAMAISPYAAQTGPARRGDTAVTDRHATVMTPRQENLYRIIAGEIADTYLKDTPL
ncbi:MAG: DUF2520 domain-containing protein [Paramuribaculum sp.]|nr:DUF2520 domain-containing protein [Paramuribaculum sp.]